MPRGRGGSKGSSSPSRAAHVKASSRRSGTRGTTARGGVSRSWRSLTRPSRKARSVAPFAGDGPRVPAASYGIPPGQAQRGGWFVAAKRARNVGTLPGGLVRGDVRRRELLARRPSCSRRPWLAATAEHGGAATNDEGATARRKAARIDRACAMSDAVVWGAATWAVAHLRLRHTLPFGPEHRPMAVQRAG